VYAAGEPISFSVRELLAWTGVDLDARVDAPANLVSFLGDAKSSLGGAKSSLGDAKSSLGGAKSSLGGAKSSLGGAKSAGWR
jgi:hypothetical protein